MIDTIRIFVISSLKEEGVKYNAHYTMTQKEFKHKWEKGLTDYLKKKDESRIDGYTRKHKDGTPATHGYIIDLKDGETDADVIKRFGILYGSEDFDRLVGKVHSMARHLNSSQVMCYNFFRPMMSIDSESNFGYANEKLVNFVREQIDVSIKKGAKCYFEYEDTATTEKFKRKAKYRGRGEKSQFDFFILDGETKIFFEIKFTESSFGGWSINKDTSCQAIANHCAYVENGYKKLLQESPCFKQTCKQDIITTKQDEFSNPKISFNKHYQLFRNALKADSCSFVVFIYPEANPGPKKEFESFSKNLVEGQKHIIALNWENLKSYMSDQFIEKYINIFN